MLDVLFQNNQYTLVKSSLINFFKLYDNFDLSFNYVTKTTFGSEIKHLRMDENGKFIDNWPQGFFTERFKVFKK